MGIMSRIAAVSRVPVASAWDRRLVGGRPAFWLAAGLASATLCGPLAGPSGADPGVTTPSTGGHDDAPRVASRSTAQPENSPHGQSPAEPTARALKAIADCQAAYAKVRDYTCTFVKRERIDGRMTHPHVMDMKARTHPTSIYFKFRTPNKGREAIYVAGKNGGKVTAHDVGIGKFIAGTMHLDPRGSMAMEDCLHPITEAGIGTLIETVSRHWNAELVRGDAKVTVNPNMRIGSHACTMIETVHPSKGPHLLFHKVRLYVSHEHGLPIRFEAYDWPTHPGAAPEAVEEYTYL
ncbi:MAG: DUF1571 domain-containing protein, partial [Planctomycetia bacterium]|nr:DUF1571 domain-containing protein [Planctomycetia bacterium]